MTVRGTASFVLAASMSTRVLICDSGLSVPGYGLAACTTCGRTSLDVPRSIGDSGV